MTIHHLSDEMVHDCIKCTESNTLVKLPTEFMIKDIGSTKKIKVGEITEDFIEETREELQQHKKELSNSSR